MQKKTYTITEAMPILGVGRTTIIYWINLGIIEAEKLKGRWVIDGDSIKDWQDFQALGLSAASEKMRERFELSFENFENMQQAWHDKTVQKAMEREI